MVSTDKNDVIVGKVGMEGKISFVGNDIIGFQYTIIAC